MKGKRFNETYTSSTTQNKVGPGKYNPDFKHSQMHQMNASNGFASKTLRCWDQRKGAISNDHIIKGYKR